MVVMMDNDNGGLSTPADVRTECESLRADFAQYREWTQRARQKVITLLAMMNEGSSIFLDYYIPLAPDDVLTGVVEAFSITDEELIDAYYHELKAREEEEEEDGQ